jgi:OHCU decarboxylase
LKGARRLFSFHEINRVAINNANRATKEEFVRLLGGVFEDSPWVAERALAARPFENVDELHSKLCEVVRQAGREEQLGLIRAHPDLVGRAALEGTLSTASKSEQASAGLDRLTPDEVQRFQNYNAEYQARFGFPFVICARLNKKEAILKGFETRLKNSREQELRTALEEIYKIAYLRLQDIA